MNKTVLYIILTIAIVIGLCTGCNNDAKSDNNANDKKDSRQAVRDEGNYQKNMKYIYVWHSECGWKFLEYKIDIQNGELWKYKSEKSGKERDSSKENEGYSFVCELKDEEIQAFKRESARHGFTFWKEEYVDESILDGHQWGIEVEFVDRTKMKVKGSNAYPETWDDLKKDFKGLTGEDVLLFQSDWLSN